MHWYMGVRVLVETRRQPQLLFLRNLPLWIFETWSVVEVQVNQTGWPASPRKPRFCLPGTEITNTGLPHTTEFWDQMPVLWVHIANTLLTEVFPQLSPSFWFVCASRYVYVCMIACAHVFTCVRRTKIDVDCYPLVVSL